MDLFDIQLLYQKIEFALLCISTEEVKMALNIAYWATFASPIHRINHFTKPYIFLEII